MSTFRWRGKDVPLFDHPHNATITNERAVELAVAQQWLGDCPFGSSGLELGNVLLHYSREIPTLRRRIVDRYERDGAPGLVENLDVFELGGSYDWIISISTLEHVRRDEEPHNPWGAVAALAYLRGMLAEGGRMLVTIGLGQNHVLDELLLGDDYPFGCFWPTTFVRTRGASPEENAWAEQNPRGFLDYGPEHGANALWIGEWQ